MPTINENTVANIYNLFDVLEEQLVKEELNPRRHTELQLQLFNLWETIELLRSSNQITNDEWHDLFIRYVKIK